MTDLETLPGYLIRRLHQISVAIFSAQLSGIGLDLTPVQFAALNVIDLHPGLDQATVAGLIAHDRVTIGGVIDRLSHKGYLLRETSPKDRRARVLALTPEGREVLASVRPLLAGIQDDILSGLDMSEREEFMTLLRKAAKAGNEKSRAPLKSAVSEA